MHKVRAALVAIFLALFSLSATASLATAQVNVQGYTRKDGTYVAPHMRSSPDGNPYNNYSFPGNTNPYTGKRATGNEDTYLRNYNNGSAFGSVPRSRSHDDD